MMNIELSGHSAEPKWRFSWLVPVRTDYASIDQTFDDALEIKG